MSKRALIFDLDGTLWDAGKPVAESWNIALKALGYSIRVTSDDLHRVMGLPMDQLEMRLLPSLPKEKAVEVGDKVTEFESEYVYDHPGVLFPGVKETLRALRKKGIYLYVLSNCQNGYIEAFFHGTGTKDLFDASLCWGEHKAPKGENMRYIMEKEGIDSAFYVGDTRGDEIETKKAGLKFVHAAYGFGTADAPDYTIKSFPELLGVADAL